MPILKLQQKGEMDEKLDSQVIEGNYGIGRFKFYPSLLKYFFNPKEPFRKIENLMGKIPSNNNEY